MELKANGLISHSESRLLNPGLSASSSTIHSSDEIRKSAYPSNLSFGISFWEGTCPNVFATRRRLL
jgi:hypothetical protein